MIRASFVIVVAGVSGSLVLAAADAAAIEIVSPKEGDRWAVGSSHRVVWKSALPATGRVEIEASGGRGASWKPVASVANSGDHLWKIPDGLGESVRLRLSAGGETGESASFAILPSQDAEYVWKKVTTTAAWAPRDGAGALVYKGRMWMLGGWNPAAAHRRFFPRICNNEVWSSADGAAWTLERANTFFDATFDSDADWEGRHTAGYVVHRDRMWIVGGDVNQGHYHFDVWSSDDGKKWDHVNKGRPVPWGPRALHYTVSFKDRIWVMGGQTVPQFAKADEVFHRDVWNSRDGATWEKVEPQEPFWPQRGMIGGSVVLDGRMWILGGGTYDTPKIPTRKYYNDVWSTADGKQWQEHVARAPWAARQYHDVAAFDGRMWVLEGYHPGGNRNDAWHSKDGVNWYEVAGTPWKPRHAAAVYAFDDGLWMVGGNNMEPDAWKLVRAE